MKALFSIYKSTKAAARHSIAYNWGKLEKKILSESDTVEARIIKKVLKTRSSKIVDDGSKFLFFFFFFVFNRIANFFSLALSLSLSTVKKCVEHGRH
jgi:hypothetical protein